MNRFVAMIWNPNDAAWQGQVNSWSEMLQRLSSRWTLALDSPGLRVFCYHYRGEAPIATAWPSDSGIIVGSLFQKGKEKSGRVLRLDNTIADQVIGTRGDNLINHYWGNYVAIWRDADHKINVLRDPCGAVHCFVTESAGVAILFAHAEDVADFPGLSFSVDWNYLKGFVLFNYFATKHTGLSEVKELLAGERLEISPDGTKTFSWAWNAADIAAHPHQQSFDEAKSTLRATAEACFTAWGNEYRNIVVSLSGGLDSSILLNLLSQVSGAKITALHYAKVGYEQFEVQLARLAATRAGVELAEAMQDPAKDEVQRILRTTRMARPEQQALSIQIDDVCNALAERTGADAFMIGQGGDNLFLQRAGATHTLTDHLSLYGPNRDTLRVAYEAALLQRDSVWNIAAKALATVGLQKRWQPFEFLNDEVWTANRLLSPEAARAIPEDYKLHPWLTNAPAAAPGKSDHLASIVALYNYYLNHGRATERDVSFPYFSQPIVELALRTPTYVLCGNGVDRALQRHAFADLLPAEIVRRTGKTGANHYLLRVLQENIAFYRALILEGSIVAQGWINREKIEHALSSDFVTYGRGATFLYQLIAAEAWLQTWTIPAKRAAA